MGVHSKMRERSSEVKMQVRTHQNRTCLFCISSANFETTIYTPSKKYVADLSTFGCI
jgi:hypothetical protein